MSACKHTAFAMSRFNLVPQPVKKNKKIKATFPEATAPVLLDAGSKTIITSLNNTIMKFVQKISAVKKDCGHTDG